VTSIAVEHGVAMGVSDGEVSDFLRVVRVGERRVIVMADGHTSGWDSGQTSLSAPVLDAVVGELAADARSAYRHVPPSATKLFDAARRAFLDAAEAHADDAEWGGPAVQLAVVELVGPMLRASWLARVELAVFRGAVVHRVTRQEPSPAIERITQPASMAELTIGHGDLVTLSCRSFVGNALEHTRSDLLASLVDGETTPVDLVTAMLARWTDTQRPASTSGGLIRDYRLILAALRV
jgi:hypothetical protein